MTGPATGRATPGTPPLDLAIVGGGPVGLVAGLLAHEAGLRFRLFEREPEPRRHSRAIGIHPPALSLLDRLGVARALVDAGTRIHRGHALSGPGRLLGSLDFGTLPPPWSFVLAIPQWRTEEILEARLREVAPGAVARGATVLECRAEGGDDAVLAVRREEGVGERQEGGAAAHPEGGAGEGREEGSAGRPEGDAGGPGEVGRPGPGEERIATRYVVACDGKGSRLRSGAGLGWQGRRYRHRYVMGDFPTAGGAHPAIPGCTPPGTDAALHLHRHGLVESFPLEAGVRRWVAQLSEEEAREAPTPALVRAVHRRCGVRLDPEACLMISAFGTERFRADRFWSGHLVLLGDAAHVVSPIGGQGMNLGWLDAADAVAGLAAVLAGRMSPEGAAANFERQAGRRLREVAARAEQNMLLGHRTPLPRLRNLAVRLLLHSPARSVLARRFTMGGLPGSSPGPGTVPLRDRG